MLMPKQCIAPSESSARSRPGCLRARACHRFFTALSVLRGKRSYIPEWQVLEEWGARACQRFFTALSVLRQQGRAEAWGRHMRGVELDTHVKRTDVAAVKTPGTA